MPFVRRTISALFSEISLGSLTRPPLSAGSGPGAPVISIVLLRAMALPAPVLFAQPATM